MDFVETTAVENVPKDSNAERVPVALVKDGRPPRHLSSIPLKTSTT
jgi:hypothetical protein